MQVSKSYNIDCAHVLDLPYFSKCSHLHGHTYTIKLVFEGERDENGFVKDFTKFPKDLIMALDHKTLVSQRHVAMRDNGQVGVLVGEVAITLPEASVYVIPGISNTSAEEIAGHLYNLLLSQGYHQVAQVQVNETGSSQACYP